MRSMKKIYYSLLYLLTLVVLAGCTNEEEDYFESSSAARADASVKSDLAVLTGAGNGWLMEYFPEVNQSYGGYNVLLKFGTDGKVTVSNEFYDSTDTSTSLYSVKQSAGIVLSFDTYNEIFHLFSDPSDPTGLGGAGYGLEGDYDFLILDATPQKVVLQGKKTHGIAVLTPISGKWDEYLSTIQEASSAMIYSKYKLAINSEEIPVSITYRTLTFTYDQDGSSVSKTASFIVTPTSLKFYEPFAIKNDTLREFVFDPTNNLFTEASNNSIKLLPVIPPINEQFVNGNWFIAYSKLGAFAQPYYSYCKTNFIDKEGEEIIYAFMGSALYGAFGFNFNSSGYAGLLGFEYKLIGEDKISLKFNLTAQGNGAYYYNNVGFQYLLHPFGASAARIFTITTDKLVTPTYVTLTEDANPVNSITLFAQQINYPYRN